MSPPAGSFRGPLARDFEAFLAFRQDLATCHEHLRVALRHLDRFLTQRAAYVQELTRPLLDEWMASRETRSAARRDVAERVNPDLARASVEPLVMWRARSRSPPFFAIILQERLQRGTFRRTQHRTSFTFCSMPARRWTKCDGQSSSAKVEPRAIWYAASAGCC